MCCFQRYTYEFEAVKHLVCVLVSFNLTIFRIYQMSVIRIPQFFYLGLHNAHCGLRICLVVRRMYMQAVEASNDHKRQQEKKEAYLWSTAEQDSIPIHVGHVLSPST